MEIHHSKYNSFEDLLLLQKKYPGLEFREKENGDIMLNYNTQDGKGFGTMLPFCRMINEIEIIISNILKLK